MHISFATANLFFTPFPQVVEVIAQAGFHSVELDLYWQGGEWAMAQHLQGVAPRQAVQWIHQAGLKVSSIHDGGGMLTDAHSMQGYINPALDRYLEQLGYAPDLIAFHTPHIHGEQHNGWWGEISGQVSQALDAYRSQAAFITIENMPPIPGYTVPLLQPQALKAFTVGHSLGVTLDTTHYAQMGQDLLDATHILNGSVHSVHLSDYLFASSRSHVLIGDGDLDLAEFFRVLDTRCINSIVLECSLSSSEKSDRQMSQDELITKLALAKDRLDAYLSRSESGAK